MRLEEGEHFFMDEAGKVSWIGPYDPLIDPFLTKENWNYIKRLNYQYYLMDKEMLAKIEKRERERAAEAENERN